MNNKTISQRIDDIEQKLKTTTLDSKPCRSMYADEGEVKTGPQRKAGYLKLISWMRENYSQSEALSKKIELILDNLEKELQ